MYRIAGAVSECCQLTIFIDASSFAIFEIIILIKIILEWLKGLFRSTFIVLLGNNIQDQLAIDRFFIQPYPCK